MPRLWTLLESELARQRGHLFPWVPVVLAIGIGAFFSLRSDPSADHIGLAFCVAIGAALSRRFVNETLQIGLVCVGVFAAGFGIAGVRAQMVATPLIEFRYYGPIEGRVIAIDRSSGDKPRLLLDQVVLQDMAPDRTPHRVRVSLHGDQRWIDPEPGVRVIMTGHLSKSPGPAEPDGFDFQRHAWFQSIGAVGYTRIPALVLAPPTDGPMWARARHALSERVQAKLEGQVGAFAAAIMTGDRSAIEQETLDALRDSNLAHLLAISGLHMGLLTGFVFGSLRLALLLVPVWGFLWPVKKLAAAAALAVGAGYLGLSGGNVATERAFVMVAVALLAVIFDRRVMSFRALALAALIVLVLRPETLLGPGFQMSFAATTALVAVFGAWQRSDVSQKIPRVLRPVAAVFLSSLIAGLATAPVAMAHFNRFAEFGLIANLIAVPAMGIVVMPAGVLAALLMPFGLEGIGLWAMEWGLSWILTVAHQVSSWDEAVKLVPSPPASVLPIGAMAGLFCLLWQGRLRWAGIVPALIAAWIWVGATRPDVLIAHDGGLVGVQTDQGRALSKAKGAGFAARIWLDNDGSALSQSEAASLWPDNTGIQHVSGKRALQSFEGCHQGDVVVSNQTLPDLQCLSFDASILRQTGAVALYRDKNEWRAVTARHRKGVRMWHGDVPEGPENQRLTELLPTDQ